MSLSSSFQYVIDRCTQWRALSLGILSALMLSSCFTSSSPSCSSEIGLCFGGIGITVDRGSRVTVAALITNASRVELRGLAWWVIAPRGTGTVWDRAIFESRVDHVDLGQSGNVKLTWDASFALPTGFYDLALAIHRLNVDGSQTPSDARYADPIFVSAPVSMPWLIRRQQATGDVEVTNVSTLTQQGHDLTGPRTLLVTVSNSGLLGANVAIQLVERTTFSGWENRWWLGEDLYATAPIQRTLAPFSSEIAAVRVQVPAILITTFRARQQWVRLTSPDSSFVDQVLLGAGETFSTQPSKGLLRRGGPSGPIEISAIGDPGHWRHTAKHNIFMTFVNLTGRSHEMKASWYLAKGSEARPWLDAVAAGVSTRITLGPWTSATVSVTAYADAPIGSWQLSAWIHLNEQPGRLVQSDVLWVSEAITVT